MPARALALIVCRARNGTIGRDGGMPWHYPEDLRRFRRLTWGHAILMGRRTHASIGRALPGRRNLVVSRQPGLVLEGCEVFPSLPAALEAAWETDPQPFVIGGAALYAEALPHATRLYLTDIQRDVAGDVRFPPFDPADWLEVAREEAADGELLFRELERRGVRGRPPPRA